MTTPTPPTDRIAFASAGAMSPAARRNARRAELFAMFDDMDASQLAAVYETAAEAGDADITAALDAYHG